MKINKKYIIGMLLIILSLYNLSLLKEYFFSYYYLTHLIQIGMTIALGVGIINNSNKTQNIGSIGLCLSIISYDIYIIFITILFIFSYFSISSFLIVLVYALKVLLPMGIYISLYLINKNKFKNIHRINNYLYISTIIINIIFSIIYKSYISNLLDLILPTLIFIFIHIKVKELSKK